jgi:anti-sigma regulatory factor (Ser/Thr protein kinase)
MVDTSRDSAMDVELDLDYDLQAPYRARRVLRSRLGDRLSPHAMQNVLTVVSELVNNSVAHGPGKPIRMRITVDDADGSVRGEVEDQGEGKVAIRKISDGGASGGFGLRLVDALTDRWGVYDGSTHVWFELDAGAATTRSPGDRADSIT